MSAEGNDNPTSTSRIAIVRARCRPCSGRPRRRHRGRRRERFRQRRPASSSALRTRARSSVVAGTSGRRGTPAGRPIIPSAAFNGIGLLVMKRRVEQRREILVDLPGRGHVARLDQLDHLTDLRPDQVARDRDVPDGAQTDVAERGPIVAAVDLEVRRCLGHQPGHALEVTRGVLHGDDVGTLRQLQQRVVLDPRRGPSRDVVDDDRELGSVGHALEVRDQPALRRLVVVRRHHEQSIRARVLSGLCQLERLSGRVRAGATDQLAAPAT